MPLPTPPLVSSLVPLFLNCLFSPDPNSVWSLQLLKTGCPVSTESLLPPLLLPLIAQAKKEKGSPFGLPFGLPFSVFFITSFSQQFSHVLNSVWSSWSEHASCGDNIGIISLLSPLSSWLFMLPDTTYLMPASVVRHLSVLTCTQPVTLPIGMFFISPFSQLISHVPNSVWSGWYGHASCSILSLLCPRYRCSWLFVPPDTTYLKPASIVCHLSVLTCTLPTTNTLPIGTFFISPFSQLFSHVPNSVWSGWSGHVSCGILSLLCLRYRCSWLFVPPDTTCLKPAGFVCQFSVLTCARNYPTTNILHSMRDENNQPEHYLFVVFRSCFIDTCPCYLQCNVLTVLTNGSWFDLQPVLHFLTSILRIILPYICAFSLSLLVNLICETFSLHFSIKIFQIGSTFPILYSCVLNFLIPASSSTLYALSESSIDGIIGGGSSKLPWMVVQPYAVSMPITLEDQCSVRFVSLVKKIGVDIEAYPSDKFIHADISFKVASQLLTLAVARHFAACHGICTGSHCNVA